ncbi:MAG: DUF1697 domain-containing protein [Alphaproteobacteria bacterium]|nr:DUF1697 domain-containing protein [Alphaproteobacteria bacterium]
MKHIALLRAVNVGGQKVTSAELKALFAAIGFKDAVTLLNSGNVVFTSTKRTGAALETYLAAEAKKRLGLDTDFMVRSAKEWRAIVDANPFPKEARTDPARLVVVMLTGAADKKAVAALEAANPGREVIRGHGTHLYIHYPDGQGESKLTVQLMLKHLGHRATARNWNTVLKLLALAEK